MFRLKPARRPRPAPVLAALAVVAATLAACVPGGVLDGPGGPRPVAGEVLGAGSVTVAMLLPLSAAGNAGRLARDMRDAAALALGEAPGDLRILVKDDRGTPEGARAAAEAAVAEGAEMILGPVFAPSVAAAAVARPADVPVVAFSTDTSIASRGVYLMGFLPETDIARIIRYSARRGNRSFAALLPADAYGSVAEAAFRSTVAEVGGRVAALERYGPDRPSMEEKAAAIAAVVKGGTVNALFMPAGETAPFLAEVLAARGVPSSAIRLLGSGQWNDPAIVGTANLDGAWFPGPDAAGFEDFAGRYRAAFGRRPIRNASLAYDAARLAVGLSARFGQQPFRDRTLTAPGGFLGVDGAFRFLADGTSQRALAVHQIEGGRAVMIDPAPRDFAAGS